MGKVWKSEFQIWGSTHFWEKHFLLLGQVNTQKCMSIWLSTHGLHFLMQWKLGSCFPSRFWLVVYVSFTLGILGFFLTIIHPRRGSLKQLGVSYVWNSHFWSCCAFLIHIFADFTILPMTGKSFLESSVARLFA